METICLENLCYMQPKNDGNFSVSTAKMFTCFILQRSSTTLPVRKVIEVTLFCNRQNKNKTLEPRTILTISFVLRECTHKRDNLFHYE